VDGGDRDCFRRFKAPDRDRCIHARPRCLECLVIGIHHRRGHFQLAEQVEILLGQIDHHRDKGIELAA
jgi:hypothetical protein